MRRKERSGGIAQAISIIEDATGLPNGIAELARRLGVTTMAVAQWGDCPPVARCPEIERITGVPCYQLRPDIFYPPGSSRAA